MTKAKSFATSSLCVFRVYRLLVWTVEDAGPYGYIFALKPIHYILKGTVKRNDKI